MQSSPLKSAHSSTAQSTANNSPETAKYQFSQTRCYDISRIPSTTTRATRQLWSPQVSFFFVYLSVSRRTMQSVYWWASTELDAGHISRSWCARGSFRTQCLAQANSAVKGKTYFIDLLFWIGGITNWTPDLTRVRSLSRKPVWSLRCITRGATGGQLSLSTWIALKTQ